MSDTSKTAPGERPPVLGPFIGDVTPTSIKLWLNVGNDADKDVFVTVRPVEHYKEAELGSQVTQPDTVKQDLKTDVAQSEVSIVSRRILEPHRNSKGTRTQHEILIPTLGG